MFVFGVTHCMMIMANVRWNRFHVHSVIGRLVSMI